MEGQDTFKKSGSGPFEEYLFLVLYKEHGPVFKEFTEECFRTIFFTRLFSALYLMVPLCGHNDVNSSKHEIQRGIKAREILCLPRKGPHIDDIESVHFINILTLLF